MKLDYEAEDRCFTIGQALVAYRRSMRKKTSLGHLHRGMYFLDTYAVGALGYSLLADLAVVGREGPYYGALEKRFGQDPSVMILHTTTHEAMLGAREDQALFRALRVFGAQSEVATEFLSTCNGSAWLNTLETQGMGATIEIEAMKQHFDRFDSVWRQN